MQNFYCTGQCRRLGHTYVDVHRSHEKPIREYAPHLLLLLLSLVLLYVLHNSATSIRKDHT